MTAEEMAEKLAESLGVPVEETRRLLKFIETHDIQVPWSLREDRCRVCNAFIGVGIVQLHLGLCESCRDAPPQ